MAAPGLMNSTSLTSPAQATQPPAPQPADDDSNASDDDDDDNMSPDATPQQKAQLVQFLARCKMLLYDRKNPKNTVAAINMLKSGNPIQALAHLALMITQRVEGAANEAGEQLDPAVLLQGGKELIDDIAEFSAQVSKQQGTPTFTDDQKNQAYLLAVDMYRQAKQKQGQPVGGLTQPAAQQLMGQYKQASEAGDLDSVLPGASEAQQLAPTLSKGAPPAPTPKGAAPGMVPKGKKKRRR